MKSILIECISRHLGEGANVDLDSAFIDIGYDSFKFIELVTIIEQKLAIEFPDEDLNIRRFERVADLVTHIEGRFPVAAAAAACA